MSSPRRMYLTRGGRGVDALFVCNVRVSCDAHVRCGDAIGFERESGAHGSRSEPQIHRVLYSCRKAFQKY